MNESPTIPIRKTFSRWWSAVAVFTLGFLWYILIDQLHVEWSVNAQYTYGWAVPLLCAILVFRRWPDRPARRPMRPGVRFWLAGLALAACWFLTRLVQEANPDWRLTSWLLAMTAVGFTLLALLAHGGRPWLKHFAFPVAFFLIAVPWPTVLEAPLVQGLARGVTAATVEVLGWLGVPALARGNLIEVSTGVVGVEEACSGIRSLQASLMLSLFFGEMNRLTGRRRLLLVLAGFALALLFNFARTLLLVWVAARQGIEAIGRWHDPAGVTILLGSFVVLWLAGAWLRRRSPVAAAAPAAPVSDAVPTPPVFRGALVVLAVWLVVVEAGVELWYQHGERDLPPPVEWTLAVPRDNPTFHDIPISDATRQFLRFDDAVDAGWRETDGSVWQVIFLRWNPGRVAVHLAQNHTPDICLPAAGRNLVSTHPAEIATARGLELPFRRYLVQERTGPVHVFYCLWEDRHPGRASGPVSLGARNRWQAVLDGRRNLGQRSLEVVIWGINDPRDAEAALKRQLEKILRVTPAGGN